MLVSSTELWLVITICAVTFPLACVQGVTVSARTVTLICEASTYGYTS